MKSSNLLCTETENGQLYLVHNGNIKIFLYKLKTNSENQELSLELIFEREEAEGVDLLGNNQDSPVLVNMIYEKNRGKWAFLIDQIRETEEEVEVSSTKIAVDGDIDNVADYYFSYTPFKQLPNCFFK